MYLCMYPYMYLISCACIYVVSYLFTIHLPQTTRTLQGKKSVQKKGNLILTNLTCFAISAAAITALPRLLPMLLVL